MTEEEARAPGLRCSGCGRDLELCGFCTEEDCTDAMCYRCVLFELREALPQPHTHGG